VAENWRDAIRPLADRPPDLCHGGFQPARQRILRMVPECRIQNHFQYDIRGTARMVFAIRQVYDPDSIGSGFDRRQCRYPHYVVLHVGANRGLLAHRRHYLRCSVVVTATIQIIQELSAP